MIAGGVQPALDTLMATGSFTPTLYVHDGEQVTFFCLVVQGQEALHATCRLVIRQRVPGAVAYALLYDSQVETEDGAVDVLIIETGDEEDEEAHQFARPYSRQKGSVAPKMAWLGPAPHLLHRQK